MNYVNGVLSAKAFYHKTNLFSWGFYWSIRIEIFMLDHGDKKTCDYFPAVIFAFHRRWLMLHNWLRSASSVHSSQESDKGTCWNSPVKKGILWNQQRGTSAFRTWQQNISPQLYLYRFTYVYNSHWKTQVFGYFLVSSHRIVNYNIKLQF